MWVVRALSAQSLDRVARVSVLYSYSTVTRAVTELARDSYTLP